MPLEAEPQLFDVLAWSLDALASGVYPGVGPDGKQLSGKRAALQGQRLSPWGHKGIYTQTTGDWKFLNEIYHFPWTQNTEQCCRACGAVKSQGDMNYADARPDAPWTAPDARRTDQEYFEAVFASHGHLPPLCRVIGWSNDTLLDDLVPDDLRGVRLNLLGSALKDMSDHNFWSAPIIGGTWQAKVNHQLQHCYRKFKTFCRSKQLEHSFTRFKVTSISMTSLSSWPELKSKAHNSAVLTLFLSEELRVEVPKRTTLPDRFRVLSSTMWGFAASYVVISNSSQRLSLEEVSLLEEARAAALQGYHFLSLDSATRGVYMFYIQPKFHKMDESLRKAIRTRRSPAWWWTFSDESFIGMVAKLSASCHKKTLGRRVVQRWLATYFSELRCLDGTPRNS